MIIMKVMQIQRTNCDEDMKAPPHKFYKRKKKTKKTHMQASLWVDNQVKIQHWILMLLKIDSWI